MANPTIHTESAQRPVGAQRGVGILERWHEARAAGKRTPLVSARNHRMLAQWLRRLASQSQERDPVARRHQVLLHYRAAAARTELLELAALLDRAHDPDPACMALLHQLLAGPDSPLYNARIPAAELRTTLQRVRAGLLTQA